MDPLEGALRSPTRFNADAAGHIFDPPRVYTCSLCLRKTPSRPPNASERDIERERETF